jgi:hypothetical protein
MNSVIENKTKDISILNDSFLNEFEIENIANTINTKIEEA